METREQTQTEENKMENETIITTAEHFGREYAEQMKTTEPNCGKFRDHDDMPEGDYLELKRAYPNATDEELGAAERAYKSAFNHE
jgi:hypothetical protein